MAKFQITNEKRRLAARELWQGMEVMVKFVSKRKGKELSEDEARKIVGMCCDMLDRNCWVLVDTMPVEG